MMKLLKGLPVGFFILLFGIDVQAQNTFPDSGKVGIGTLNPNAFLTVNGNINLNRRAQYGGDYPTDNSNYTNVLAIGGIGAEAGLKIYKQNSGESPTFTGTSNWHDSYVFEMTDTNQDTPDGGIVFGGTGQDDIFEGILYIKGNNRVGIGTKSPKNKLDVNGVIRSQEVKVETTGWPDFVFEDNYDLPELYELEKYIQQYQHLPEIPKAHEIKQNGQQLGAIQVKLLQKLEELTLHTIRQQKQIDSLLITIQKQNRLINELQENKFKR